MVIAGVFLGVAGVLAVVKTIFIPAYNNRHSMDIEMGAEREYRSASEGTCSEHEIFES